MPRLITSQGHDIEEMAREMGTPLYIYDSHIIHERARELRSAFGEGAHIHYAMKANNNLNVLQCIRNLGFGVDTVSEGEIFKAIESGFSPDQVIFSGVGKTVGEIRYALESGVRSLNVESLDELQRIGDIARSLGRIASVMIRLNPNVSVKTHPYIRTGHGDDKFGLQISDLAQARHILDHNQELDLQGFAMHLGSQIFQIPTYLKALKILSETAHVFAREGYPIRYLDIGGGFGVSYEKQGRLNIRKLGFEVEKQRKKLSQELGLPMEIIIEPGRYLVAESGILVTEVQYVKKTKSKNFVIVDTGMHHLLRPALYQAYHEILPVLPRKGKKRKVEVVGPICESSDTLGEKRTLPPVQSGDLLAILNTGAYGSSMSSDYNLRPRAKEVVV